MIVYPKKRIDYRASKLLMRFFFLIIAALSGVFSVSAQQVKGRADTTSIRIGEQINYQVEVITDSTDLVIFPEGQTFSPLEMIESYKVDTSFAEAKLKLIKRYGLTKFDSGSYTIPQQRILINEQAYLTDSVRIEVANVQVDTTKQGLYDIKNIIEVEPATGRFWNYLLWVVGILLLIALLVYLFLRRKRKKAEAAQKIPPFEQALVSLRQLDEEFKTPGPNADQAVTKAYYSRLTNIVRRYLNDEVYSHSMESTTSELIERLLEEKQKGTVDFSKETIQKLEQILKRADLTKFARTSPQQGQAEADRLIAEQIVKETKEAIPEPTEEELLRDEAYRKALAKRRKRKLIFQSIAGFFGILILAIGILIATKGFDYVKDNFIGHPSKELLEGEWVRSEYGYPPVTVSTPRVLKRVDIAMPDSLQMQMEISSFVYGSLIDDFTIMVNNARFPGNQQADLEKAVEGMIANLESRGVKNLVVKNEKYTTPNGAEGLKTYGTGEFPETLNTDKYSQGEYIMLSFTAPGVIQQVVVAWRKDDKYAAEMAERIINSVELQNASN